MDETSETSPEGLPEAIGRMIGVALVAVVASLVGSLLLSLAWNHGPAQLFDLPPATWAESLACLVSIFILSAPVRFVRVKHVE